MTEPDSADTGRMRAAAEGIEQTYQRMAASSDRIVELLGELAGAMNEAGSSRALVRLGESLREADNQIHACIRDTGQDLGDTAVVIERVLEETEADRDAVTRQISGGGGKYGNALNG